MKNDAEQRAFRLNGTEPTARDKWKAFHRLWRLAHRGKDNVYKEGEVAMCFTVLFPNWRAIRCLEARDGDGLADRSFLPLPIRRQLLETARRRRLYNGHWEWREQDKQVAAKVWAEDGTEVTPDEVAEVRRKIINQARETAARYDFPLPADDAEVLKILKSKTGG